MDFVHDSMLGGRRLRDLTIVAQFTRECPAIEVDTSITGQRVVRVLERLGGNPGTAPGAGAGQRTGVHRQGPGGLGTADAGAAALHHPGQAGVGRTRRELQPEVSG